MTKECLEKVRRHIDGLTVGLSRRRLDAIAEKNEQLVGRIDAALEHAQKLEDELWAIQLAI